MKPLLLTLAALCFPFTVQAACNPMIALPCVDEQNARAEQRLQSYGRSSEPAVMLPPLGSITNRHMQAEPRVPGPTGEWTYYQTPNGRYTNYGNGWIVGPQGPLIPY